MPKESVDIITRTKNRSLYLERTINSVLAQTYQNWNHIIINDGGDKATVDQIIEKYQKDYKNRIQIIHNETSLGMEGASNCGIQNSHGNYIVILDDDDTWEKNFLSKTVHYLQNKPHPLISGVITWANIIKEQTVNNKIQFISKKTYTKNLFCIDISEIIKNNLFTTNSFLFERKALNTCGLFDTTLPVLGDWDFNLRFLQHFEIGVLPEYLSNYHHRPIDKNQNTSNSIFEGQSRHRFYQTYVRNKYLREDLQNGKLGLGVLMTILKDFKTNENLLTRLLNYSLFSRTIIELKKILASKA
jgi:glycosyltransferase involved in cell wall biosynthesis